MTGKRPWEDTGVKNHIKQSLVCIRGFRDRVGLNAEGLALE